MYKASSLLSSQNYLKHDLQWVPKLKEIFFDGELCKIMFFCPYFPCMCDYRFGLTFSLFLNIFSQRLQFFRTKLTFLPF